MTLIDWDNMVDLEIIRNTIIHLDQISALVSNTDTPRKDNNYGRAAQALSDALVQLEEL